MRFALWHNTKWLLIDDASDGHNLADSASQRIHTTSAAVAAALTMNFRELLGCMLRKGAEIRAASCDMKGAYKQLGVREDQLRHVVNAVDHPILKRWVFAK